MGLKYFSGTTNPTLIHSRVDNVDISMTEGIKEIVRHLYREDLSNSWTKQH